jgi:uncharacterized protein (TIGR03083 family)
VSSADIPPLRDLLGALETRGRAPSVALRDATLASAFAARAAGLPPAVAGTPAGLLVEVSDALDADLIVLDAEAWQTPVMFDWSVQDVIAHLAAVNELAASRITGRDVTAVDVAEIEAANHRAVQGHRSCTPADTLAAWRASVARLRHGLAACDAEVNWLGLCVPAGTVIVDRAFETWIHANDIRHAIGRASLDPSGQHLRVLCDLAVELLPLALAVTGRAHTGTMHIALSGPGGGEWTVDLGMGRPGTSEVTFQAAARELCLLMGDRIDARDFAYTVRGSDDAATIAADVVASANVFARP